jgi:hypothetical protein
MKGFKTYFIGSTLILILYLLAQYYKPRPTDWTASYLKEDKIPYGLYILNQETNQLFPETKTIISISRVYNTLKDKRYQNTNYLIVAGKVKLDAADWKELTQFVKAGNHVLIATYDLGNVVQEKLKIKLGSYLPGTNNKKRFVRLVNPKLDSAHHYYLQKELGLQYFDELDTARAVVLGKDSRGRTNFIKYPIGKGALFILPDPQLLTNYSLLDPEGAAYAARVMSYLPDAETLIWDENNTRGNVTDSSYLRVIFGHSSLTWAYNLTILGLLLFVFFELKRRQRIIPLLLPLKNSSVEFVKVVAKVYYQQRDNRDIAFKKITYFLEYLRTTYHLKTADINDELAAALVLKSGVPDETVRELLNLMNSLKTNNKVNDLQLINLNQLIEKFYRQAL